jgi:hypothetical protein
VLGPGSVNAVARAIAGIEGLELHSMADIFGRFLPTISLQLREHFRNELTELVQASDRPLPGDIDIYLTKKQLRGLAAFDFEIGNHTYTHVHCRTLSNEDIHQEIDRNRAELEAVSGSAVRCFSVPYGSSADLTIDVAKHLSRSGYRAVFLSESVANCKGYSMLNFDRISIHADNDEALFIEIEVLPRLRAVRNQVLCRSQEGLHGGDQSVRADRIHGDDIQ